MPRPSVVVHNSRQPAPLVSEHTFDILEFMFEAVVSHLVDLTDEELHERLGELELQQRETQAELAAAIAVADSRVLYQRDAHRSMKGYLKATCNWSAHEVARWRSWAAAVNAHAEVGDAWRRGRIGSAQVNKLAQTHGNRRVRDHLPAFVSQLVANAEELCFEDFAVTVDHFVQLADVDGAHDERDDAIEHRRARVDKNGAALDMSVFGGDGVTTDEVIGIYEAFCAAELDRDLATRAALHGSDAGNHELARTAAAARKTATIASWLRCAAAGHGAAAAQTVVNIVVDSKTFARMLAAAGLAPTSIDGVSVDPFTGLPASNTLLKDLMVDPAALQSIKCETDRGVPVHPHDVLRAALAGHVRRVVLDSNGHVVDFGRKKRLFEGPGREAAKLLVTRCQHPGCDLPSAWSDVDHNKEWVDQGETNQANAGVLCARHNRAKHHLGLARRRAANGADYTFRADGTIILPVGARIPQFDDDDVPDSPEEIRRMEHIARERLRAYIADSVA